MSCFEFLVPGLRGLVHDWDVLEVGAGVQAPALAEHHVACTQKSEPFVSQGLSTNRLLQLHRWHPHCKCHFHPFSVVREIELSPTLLHVHPRHRLEFAVFAKCFELLNISTCFIVTASVVCIVQGSAAYHVSSWLTHTPQTLPWEIWWIVVQVAERGFVEGLPSGDQSESNGISTF